MFDWFRIILNPSKRETSQYPNLDECSMRMVIQRLEILSVSYLLSERFGDGNVITQFFKTGLPHNNFHSTCEDNAPYHCEETHKKQSKERPCNLEMEYPWISLNRNFLYYYGPARAGPLYEIRIREAYAFLRDECINWG